MGFWNTVGRGVKGIVSGRGLTPSFKDMKRGLEGTPEERQNISTLQPRQQSVLRDVTRAAKGRGAPGAIGEAADIYRDLPDSEAAQYYRENLSDNPKDLEAFSRPAMRQFSEQIAPGLAEQYAGMGAGGSNGGFQNSVAQAGVDLSERLGALRANLRQNSAANLHNLNMQRAQGLQGISNNALGNFSQNMVTRQGTPGLLSQSAPLIGTIGGGLIGGAPGAMIGNQAGQMYSNSQGGNRVGANTIPNWSEINASPKLDQRG